MRPAVRMLVADRLCARRANCAAPSHTPALSEPQASPNDQYGPLTHRTRNFIL